MEEHMDHVLESCLEQAGIVDESVRPMLAAIILLFTLIGILTNLTVLSVIITHWKTSFGSQHFTYFVINMIIPGLLYAATNLWMSIPCTFDGCLYFSSDTLMITLATPNTLAHWGYLLSSLSFTIYRFGIFISKNFYYQTFIIKILFISPWVISLALTVGTTALGCYKRYNRYSLSYTYKCSDCSMAFGISFIDVNFYAGQAIPLMMISAYVFILASIYRGRRRGTAAVNQRQSRVDAKLAVQFTVICSCQYLAAFLFFIVPKMSNGAIWGILVMNCIGTINVSVNPIVLLLFNNQVHDGILTILGCQKDKGTRATPSRWTVHPTTLTRY